MFCRKKLNISENEKNSAYLLNAVLHRKNPGENFRWKRKVEEVHTLSNIKMGWESDWRWEGRFSICLGLGHDRLHEEDEGEGAVEEYTHQPLGRGGTRQLEPKSRRQLMCYL